MQRRDGARARGRGGAGRWSLAAAGDSSSLRLLGKKGSAPAAPQRREAAADKSSPAFPRGAWDPSKNLSSGSRGKRRLQRLLAASPQSCSSPAPLEEAGLKLPASGRSRGVWIAFRYSEGKATGEWGRTDAFSLLDYFAPAETASRHPPWRRLPSAQGSDYLPGFCLQRTRPGVLTCSSGRWVSDQFLLPPPPRNANKINLTLEEPRLL